MFVSGYNHMANLVGGVSGFVPSPMRGSGRFLAEKLSTEGLKTFAIKPLMLIGSTFRFMETQGDYPFLRQLSADAHFTKGFIGIFDVFVKFPKMIESLSKPVEQSYGLEEVVRKYATTDGKLQPGAKFSNEALVFSRWMAVASWGMAVGDAIQWVGKYRPLSASWIKLTPWIYVVAGGYMATNSLYTEARMVKKVWFNQKKDVAPIEKCYSCLNLAFSVTGLFTSALGMISIYYEGKAPGWINKYQFASAVGMICLPMAQRAAEAYIKAHFKAEEKID